MKGNAFFGTEGSNDFNDTSLHTGSWYVIEAIGGDAVFTTCTMEKGEDKDGATLYDGKMLWGKCTAIQLSSGTVRAYIRDES